MHMAAAHQMHRPHRRLYDGDPLQRHLLARFEHDETRPIGTRQPVALRVTLDGKPGFAVAVDAALAADGQIALPERVEQHVMRLLGAAQRLKSLIIGLALAGEQHRARFKVQLKMGRQIQAAAAVTPGGQRQAAAARGGDLVDSALQHRRVQGFTVGGGMKISKGKVHGAAPDKRETAISARTARGNLYLTATSPLCEAPRKISRGGPAPARR